MFIGMTVKEAIAKLEEKGWDYRIFSYLCTRIISLGEGTGTPPKAS